MLYQSWNWNNPNREGFLNYLWIVIFFNEEDSLRTLINMWLVTCFPPSLACIIIENVCSEYFSLKTLSWWALHTFWKILLNRMESSWNGELIDCIIYPGGLIAAMKYPNWHGHDFINGSVQLCYCVMIWLFYSSTQKQYHSVRDMNWVTLTCYISVVWWVDVGYISIYWLLRII